MFVFQTLLILLAVYAAPALAIRPGLMTRPGTAAAIPFISVLIIFLAASGLILIGAFTPFAVRALGAGFVAIAAFRIFRMRPLTPRFTPWTMGDLTALAVALAFGAYVTLRLIEGGFDDNDEIYSWNLWAVQHFRGEPADFFYTQAPYPQLFPKLLAFGYKLLGSIEAQTPVKTALAIFPAAIFFLIGLAARPRDDLRAMFLQALLCLLLMKGAGLDSIFDDGLPDTLTAGSILLSLFCIHRWQRDPLQRDYLYLAIAAAILAALAKQPGLLWALFALPLLLASGAVTKKNTWRDAAFALLPAAIAILWIFTEGSNFHDNEGVVTRSFSGRDPLSQLAFAADKWLWGEPAIAIMVIGALGLAFRPGARRDILALVCLPFFLIWFFYAAYDIRAGAPALLCLGFFIASARYGLTDRAAPTRLSARFSPDLIRRVFIIALFALLGFGGYYELASYRKEHPDFRIGDTARSNLYGVFGPGADTVYEQIRTRDVTLWNPTNYVYGLFYGHIEVIRPQAGAQETPATVLAQIRKIRPDYLTDGGIAPIGPGGPALNRLAQTTCPQLFETIVEPNNKYRITVYRLNKSALASEDCAP